MGPAREVRRADHVATRAEQGVNTCDLDQVVPAPPLARRAYHEAVVAIAPAWKGKTRALRYPPSTQPIAHLLHFRERRRKPAEFRAHLEKSD